MRIIYFYSDSMIQDINNYYTRDYETLKNYLFLERK